MSSKKNLHCVEKIGTKVMVIQHKGTIYIRGAKEGQMVLKSHKFRTISFNIHVPNPTTQQTCFNPL